MTASTARHGPSLEVRALLAELPAAADEPGVDSIRCAFAEFVRAMDARGEAAAVAPAVDEELSGVPVRTYEPLEAGGQLEALVFLHGGGWAVGDLDTADAGARALCAGLGARVVSVGYRLAPEHPFPAGLEDALAVLEQVSDRTEGPVAVAGESAGGNLAAAAALAWRDRGGRPPAAQILINPLLDASCASGSHRELGEGYGLTTADCLRYVEWYRGGAALTEPLLSPLVAESLAELPPAVVVSAGFDPLRDDGVRYAQRLIEAEVDVRYLPMPAMLHGWWSVIPASGEAQAQARRLVRAVGSMLEP